MSYTSGFFDAVDLGGGDYDREYSAAVFAHYFSLLVKNGVFPDPSTGMQVKASSSPDMHVSVQPGNGWINGYYITVPENSPEVLTVPTANPSLSRIDSVIMGLNYVEREIQLYIKPGAVSASPIPVSLQRDNDLYELELAQIFVSAGVASVVQANITDMRTNTSRCGIVKGTIDQIDTTDLFAQYDDAFQTWFNDIKDQLSGNVTTNLKNQINELKEGKVNVLDKATTAQAQAGTDDTKWMTPSLVATLLTYRLATASEVKTGAVDTKWVSPLKLFQALTATDSSLTIPWARVDRLTNIVTSLNKQNAFGFNESVSGGTTGQTSNTKMAFNKDGWQTTNLSYFNTLTVNLSAPKFCPKVTVSVTGKGTGDFSYYVGYQRCKYKVQLLKGSTVVSSTTLEQYMDSRETVTNTLEMDVPYQYRSNPETLTVKLIPTEVYYSRGGNSGTYYWDTFDVQVATNMDNPVSYP